MVGSFVVFPRRQGTVATEAVVDLKKLTPGEMVIAICGILIFFVGLLFDWFGIDITLGSQTIAAYDEGGFGNFWTLIAIILAVIAAIHVIVDKFTGVEMPERIGNVGWGMFYLIGGGISTLFVLIAILLGVEERGVDLDPQIGVWLGLLLSIGFLVGGFLVAKERGDLAALQNKGGAGGSSTPPAPPAA